VSGDDPLTGSRWFGRGRGASAEARKALDALQVDYPRAFYIRAMDPFTGRKVWDYPMPFGHEGVLSTAGGLVFLGSPNGGLLTLAMAAGVAYAQRGTTAPRPPAGQTSAYNGPRTSDHKPDFNGIWQVLSTAHWNLEAHSASDGVPAGLSVVDGGAIPYQPWAL